MIRHAVAIAVALCLSPSLLSAQSTILTVNTVSANVHKFPSIASPVIGKAPRGSALEVTRELGDWVRVSWPGAEEGVGFVRMSTGSMARGSSVQSKQAIRTAAAPPPPSAVSSSAAAQAPQPVVARQPAPQSALVAPPTHFIGIGVRAGEAGSSTLGFGAGARAWSRGPLGAQLEVSRYTMTGTLTLGQMTSTQIAPSVLFAFPDRVSDYMWIRPYVGAGARLYRSSLSGAGPGLVSLSDNGFGAQAFGGGELTFASAPRFAVSIDAGYYSSRTPFVGFALGGLGFSVSGHWYLK